MLPLRCRVIEGGEGILCGKRGSVDPNSPGIRDLEVFVENRLHEKGSLNTFKDALEVGKGGFRNAQDPPSDFIGMRLGRGEREFRSSTIKEVR